MGIGVSRAASRKKRSVWSLPGRSDREIADTSASFSSTLGTAPPRSGLHSNPYDAHTTKKAAPANTTAAFTVAENPFFAQRIARKTGPKISALYLAAQARPSEKAVSQSVFRAPP